MVQFVNVPVLDAGEDESDEISVNVDLVLWVDELDGNATLEFMGVSNRTLACTRKEFLDTISTSRGGLPAGASPSQKGGDC